MKKRHFSRNQHLWVIAGFILVAFGLYLYQLDGQSLWRDEGLSVARARQSLPLIFTNRNIIRGVASPDLHPPFYFLLLHGWRRLAGESEFAYRFPSVVAAVFTIAMLFAAGRRIWGAESGIWAAFLATLSPFYFWYAQEARMYTWLALESAALLYTLWPLLHQRHRKRDVAYFGVTGALMIYTHYSGAFLVGFALAAILMARLRRPNWRLVTAVLLGIGVIALPLYPMVYELLTARGFIAFSIRPPWKMFYEAINTFSLGAAVPMPAPGWRLAPFVVLGMMGSLGKRQNIRVLLIGVGCLLGTLMLFYLAAWAQANYSNPRHLTLLSPVWFLLMGHGLVNLRRWLWPLAVVVGLAAMVAGGLALRQTITEPPVIRDDVRALAAYIEQHAQPGDAIIWHNAVMSTLYDYYALDLPYTAVPGYSGNSKEAVAETLATWMASYERIWFVHRPSPPFFDANFVPDTLAATWMRVDEAHFPASWTSLRLRLYHPFQVVDALPPDNLPVNLQQDGYHFQGISTGPDTAAGTGTWVSLFWRVDHEFAASSPDVCLRLLDSTGTIWSQRCTRFTLPETQSSPATGFIKQQLWLPLPTGLAPIPYTLALTFAGKQQEVGTLLVERPPTFPDMEPVAVYENGLELLAVEWSDDQFRTGLWVLGDLIWRANRPLGRDLVARARLVDWRGRTVAEQAFPVAPSDFPASQWQAGDVVRGRMTINLPPRIEGKYRVQLSLMDTKGNLISQRHLFSPQWHGLGTVAVQGWPFTDALPDAVTHRPHDVAVGDGDIYLAGYNLRRQDGALYVDLYWRNETELTSNYGIFVHVGRSGDPPLAQDDTVDWTRPVSGWRTGEIVHTTHTLLLPPELDEQDVSVRVGMYELEPPHGRLSLTVNGQPTPDNAFNLGPLP